MNKLANPEMILLARDSRGMTQKELAQALNVTQVAISKAEKIEGKISDTLLEKMAKVLDYPINFFYQKEYRYSPATPLMHRKQKSLPARVENQIEAEANVRKIHIENMLDSVDIPEANITWSEFEDLTPEEAALALRIRLRLPRGPIQNMTDVVEQLGIIIVPCRFNTSKLDGFTLFGKAKTIIHINQEMPWCRLRFTLAHELGHIILNHLPGPSIEEEANAFASSFLMPRDDIGRDFAGERIDLHLLAMLKPRWKVSMQAILFRAMSLGYLTKNQNMYLWMTISQAGYKKREPAYLDIPPEEPKTLKAMIDVHLSELEYSKEELFDILMTSEKAFEELYPFYVKKPKQGKVVRLYS